MKLPKQDSRRRRWLLALVCLSFLHSLLFINVSPSVVRTALSLPLLLPVERMQTPNGPIAWTLAMLSNSILWGMVLATLFGRAAAPRRLSESFARLFVRSALLALWLGLIVTLASLWIDSRRHEFVASRGDSALAVVHFQRIYLFYNVKVDPSFRGRADWPNPSRWHWSSLQSSGWGIDVIERTGSGFGKWGFAYRSVDTWDRKSVRRAVIFPCWFAFAVIIALPLVPLTFRRLRREGYRKGCCERCGYDLRATPERCPECGLTPPSRRG